MTARLGGVDNATAVWTVVVIVGAFAVALGVERLLEAWDRRRSNLRHPSRRSR